MRFKTSHKLITPQHGETRVTNKFAWLPKLLEFHWVWFERYEIMQGFFYKDYPAIIEGERITIRAGVWINLSERLIRK